MACIFDARWIGQHGIGRFALEVGRRISSQHYTSNRKPMSPLDPFLLPRDLRHLEGGGNWFFSPGYNAPLFGRMPYILTVHDLNHIDRPENSSQPKRLYYRMILSRLCANASAILTVSNFSKDRLVEWMNLDSRRVFNVGNGVSEAFSPKGPTHIKYSNYILCVSNRKGHKNEFALLHAYAKSGLCGKLGIVLTGSSDSKLLAHAQELGIGSCLQFTDRISELELASLYRGATFLAFPSLYEGFGLPIAEAFACGTPVLTSNTSAMPEIAGNSAILVDPTDVDEIATSMSRLYNSVDLRNSLMASGLDRAKYFSWDSVAEKIISIASNLSDSERSITW